MGSLAVSGVAGYFLPGEISQVKMMIWFPREKVPAVEQGR